MKDVKAILVELYSLGIHLNLVDDSLKVKAPKEVLTDDVVGMIRTHSRDLKNYLRKNNASTDNLINLSSVQRSSSGHVVSFSQKNILMAEAVNNKLDENLIKSTFIVNGSLDEKSLEQSFKDLIARHEILRTKYVLEQGEYRQIVDEQLTSEIIKCQLDDSERSINIFLNSLGDIRFDLSRESSIKISLCKLAKQKYILSFIVHHVATDGMGLSILARDFLAFYHAHISHTEVSLPSINFQYIDFAQWQHSNGNYEKDLNYWKHHLAQVATHCSFPNDKAKNIEKRIASECVQLLSMREYKEVEVSASKLGVTTFMYLQGIFSYMMSRYSGNDVVTIGTPSSGRVHHETEEMLGCFVNTLVLKTECHEDTISNYFSRVKANHIRALEHQQVPFSDVVNEVSANNSTTIIPWIQIVFKMHLTPERSFSLDNLQLVPLEHGEKQIAVDIDVAISQSEEGVEIIWSYDQSLFHAASIDRYAASFFSLINQFNSLESTDNLSAVTLDTSIMKNGDINEILPTRLLHHAFEEVVKQYPHSIALVDGNSHVSFEELNVRANQLAHTLLDIKIFRDDVIAVGLDRGIEAIVAMLAVLKAGGAVLPIDVTTPKKRVSYMCEMARARAIITTSNNRQLFEDCESPIEVIDALTFTQNLCLASEDNPVLDDPQNDRLAYVIFTSGSTGNPKGVMVEHHSIVDQNVSEILDYAIGHQDRLLHLISFSFDPGIAHLFACLNSGATCYLSMKNADVLSQLEHYEITHASFPASVLTVYEPIALPHLRLVTAGAEKCPKAVAKKWSKDRTFFYNYGPTEATVIASYGTYKDDGVSAMLGKPTRGTSLYIFGPDQSLVPKGAIGELFIGGQGLARGYIGDPQLTESRFIDNPIEPNERLYRTGDLVRIAYDGNLEFIGRIDDQIKINGHRIELGEIESALLNHREVENAVVTFNQESDKKFLTAYMKPVKALQYQEVWPSVSEFDVLDDVMYQSMVNNTDRVNAYNDAFNRHLAGKTVLEVGPGSTLVLTKLMLKAGAKHVYAIEIDEQAFKQAKKELDKMLDKERVTLLLGDAKEILLPEKVDYCISSIIGSIGSGQGAEQILSPVKKHLKDHSHMIPERAVNFITAVDLDDAKFAFSDTSAFYTEKIFEQTNRKFDLRLSLKGFDQQRMLTTKAIFDDLDFTREIKLVEERRFILDVVKRGGFSGFVISLQLFTDEHSFIDNLVHSKGLLPIYVPLNTPSIQLKEGDLVEGIIKKRQPENTLRTDYKIIFVVKRNNNVIYEAEIVVDQVSEQYKHNAFYQNLFAQETLNCIDTSDLENNVRLMLSKALPDYMVPKHVVTLQYMPLTNNGKIDKSQLPDIRDKFNDVKGAPPQGEVQHKLSNMWSELLEVDTGTIKQESDFFELGGHSLLAIKLKLLISSQLNIEVDVKDIFDNPQLKMLARFVDELLLQSRMKQVEDQSEILSEGTL